MSLAAYFPMILTEVTPIAMSLRCKKFYNIGSCKGNFIRTCFSPPLTFRQNKLECFYPNYFQSSLTPGMIECRDSPQIWNEKSPFKYCLYHFLWVSNIVLMINKQEIKVLSENKKFWDKTDFWISMGFDHAFLTTLCYNGPSRPFIDSRLTLKKLSTLKHSSLFVQTSVTK